MSSPVLFYILILTPALFVIKLVPPQILEKRVFDVWKGWLYSLEFRNT